MILVVAMLVKGVVGEGFQRVAFPAARDSARFLREGKRGVSEIGCTENAIDCVPAIDCDGEVESRKDTNYTQRIRN